MPLPEFTSEELYLINSVKSQESNRQPNSYMWGYLVPTGVLAGVAAYNENISLMLIAFGIVYGFRIYEESFQNQWLPTWLSIITKYENGCTSVEKASTSKEEPDSQAS